MKQILSFRSSLTVTGLLVLACSILHCFQHLYFADISESNGYTQHSVYLFNWSVALLLLFMAVVTLSVARSKKTSTAQLKQLAVVLIVTWSCRLLFEVVYPVTFRFLIFDQPTTIIKVGIIILLWFLLTPFLRLKYE